jgi:hypothetical protein
MSRRPGAGRPAGYELRLLGVLDRHWSGWFDGLLARVRDLGLPLLSVQRISPGPEPEEEEQ